jgi:hypothetical protein
MSAPKVFANNHVLNSLTGTGHVHTVRKVFPENTWVVSFFLEDFIGLVPNSSRDVISLKNKTGSEN